MGCPSGDPLNAPCAPNPWYWLFGCRSGALSNERDFLRSHSFPLRSLRVRRFLADPLARLPFSLSCGRRTRIRFDCRCCTDGATACRRFCLPPHRPPASRFARVPFLLGRCAASLFNDVRLIVDGAGAPRLFFRSQRGNGCDGSASGQALAAFKAYGRDDPADKVQ